ncbi:very-long-chain (3R)-3-hydroxyacyl-CoA dehydratase 3-like [Ciona intestinalis]
MSGDNATTDMETFYPNVLWAQRKETISLKVEIGKADAPNIKLGETSLDFEAQGTGATGEKYYKFHLDFFLPIDPEGCVYKNSPHSVEIQITKAGVGKWWPRLVPVDQKKPHFLKLNFDKWSTESDEEEQKAAVRSNTVNNEVKDDSNHKNTAGNIYLLTYNGIQFMFFSVIFVTCLTGRLRSGSEVCPTTYDTIGWLVIFSVILSYVEAVHPVLGLVKSSWFQPFIQVSGRCFALLCLWLAEPTAKDGCSVSNLFIAWSLAEVIRYPTYTAQILGIELKALSWLRYHAWIILYPFGGYSEFEVISAAANYLDEKNIYKLTLPNIFNFSFKLSSFMRLYTAVLVIGVLVLMRHMWKMRQRKFGKRMKYKPA